MSEPKRTIEDYKRYYYLANQERLQKKGREYHYANRQKHIDYSRKYYQENRERIKEQRNARTARHEPKVRKRAHLVVPNKTEELETRRKEFETIHDYFYGEVKPEPPPSEQTESDKEETEEEEEEEEEYELEVYTMVVQHGHVEVSFH